MRHLILAAAAAALIAGPALAKLPPPPPAAQAAPATAKPAKASKSATPGTSKMGACAKEWNAKSDADKAKYKTQAVGMKSKKGNSLSGYNLFTSQCMKKAERPGRAPGRRPESVSKASGGARLWDCGKALGGTAALCACWMGEPFDHPTGARHGA